MPMTRDQGLTTAKALAQVGRNQYSEVSRIYGPALDSYLGQVPRGIAVSHVLRINPRLRALPNFTEGQYRGFMRVSVEAASLAGIVWDRLKDPNLCAYVWLRYLNYGSYDLYQKSPYIFTTPDETFWRCAYLQDAVGKVVFDYLWAEAAPSSDSNAYEDILYVVMNNTKTIGNLSPHRLATLVFRDCEFVFQLTKLICGTIQSSGPGEEPIPPTREVAAFFTKGKVTRG